ncbi:class I adenylate-forming enzyme family protein [Paenibacillus sp. FJAT-27812]|uniref:class I adenylate-forming enzyme family protein n=1 Tax=Paenibacillus sp. FJAT-27812 TaxID=1684143 RepID=UPI0006A78F51|nr:class I adenylate-forming enzyme family protein [Paenibacillus sp. FJAT-27812]
MLLSKILQNAARLYPAHIAMKAQNVSLTYEELFHQVSRAAWGFNELSIKPGERIALLGNPSPYLAIAEYAAVAIGAIPVTIFPGLAAPEMKQILSDASPAAIVYDHEHAPYSIENFISNCPAFIQWHEADPDDTALLIYTGGTTGRSKGVMHSHRRIRNWASMNPERGGGHNPTKKSLVPNQAHLTGQFILWSALFEGGCLIYADSYPLQAEEVVAIIEREQLKFLGTVGLLFRDIIHIQSMKAKPLLSIEGISCGGAPISERTFHQASAIFPNAQITEVYSQTESGQFISFLSINPCFVNGMVNRLRSVGRPEDLALWGQKPFSIRIVDEYGKDVNQGGVGEIICQGEQMMLGYWNNPEETSKSIRDGWLYTGDIGRFDEDGYLYLLDRKKDMIIVNGSNVYCSEVEEALSKHPSILEIAVVGTPLPEEGEEVTAAVILKSDRELTLDGVKQFCLNQIAEFKIPTRLEIADAFPRTSVGKINKAELRKTYWGGKTRLIN